MKFSLGTIIRGGDFNPHPRIRKWPGISAGGRGISPLPPTLNMSNF